MKKILPILLGIIGLAALILATHKCSTDNTEENSPVDLSEVLKTYEQYTKSPDTYERDSLLISIVSQGYPECMESIGLISGDSVSVDLSEFSKSNHPMLRQANDIYNSNLVFQCLYSDVEAWIRFKYPEQEGAIPDKITDAMKKFNASAIKDKELQAATTRFINTVNNTIVIDSTTSEVANSHMAIASDSMFEAITGKLYKFADNADKKTIAAEIEKYKALVQWGEDYLKNYNDADSASRLKVILDDLNKCKTFDEQCSLWLAWASSEKSKDEELWYTYVAHKLLSSGNYSVLLQPMWDIWRAEVQIQFYGLSTFSNIPNQFYNELRTQCYIATLKHIDKNPNDLLAMDCAASIAMSDNLARFGGIFGNKALVRLTELLPEHYGNYLSSEPSSEDGDKTE